MEFKGTKGEWKAEGTREIVIHSEGNQIAFMSVQNKDTEANAKLIAAAPDMLKIAQEVVFLFDKNKNFPDGTLENKILQEAKAAIEKALK